jgi:hypothetical protein
VVLHCSIVVGMAEQTVPLFIFGLTCVSTYWLYFMRPTPAPEPPAAVTNRAETVGA